MAAGLGTASVTEYFFQSFGHFLKTAENNTYYIPPTYIPLCYKPQLYTYVYNHSELKPFGGSQAKGENTAEKNTDVPHSCICITASCHVCVWTLWAVKLDPIYSDSSRDFKISEVLEGVSLPVS